MKKKYHILIVFILTITSCFAQWIPVNKGIEDAKIYKIIGNNDVIFAKSENYGILISKDFGESWLIPGIGSGWCEDCLCLKGDTVLCATGRPNQGKIYYSNDTFKTWNFINTSAHISTMALVNDIIYYGDFYGYLFYTSDFGKNWKNQTNNLCPYNSQESVADIMVNGDRVFLSLWGGPDTETHGIYFSDDKMNTFTKAILNDKAKIQIKFFKNNNNLFASASGFCYVSIDSGYSWNSYNESFGELTPGHLAFDFLDSIIIAGSFIEAKIVVSFNNGMTWIKKDKGIEDIWVNCLTIYGNYVFAGTSNGIYRARLDELTAVDDKKYKTDFTKILPNPFSEKTRISFNLEEPTYAKITVYNFLGFVIDVLAEGYLSEGYHEFTFDGSALASGTYYYVLQVNGKVESGKLVLIK
jgi:hypothetical protein